jgi:hypothetical protein
MENYQKKPYAEKPPNNGHKNQGNMENEAKNMTHFSRQKNFLGGASPEPPHRGVISLCNPQREA